jgi:hypothetical protein
LHGTAYYIFIKSLRSIEEFRKNPHVKIPPKSPSTNFQSLDKFKNPIFIRKRIFLHFRPIRPSSQPAYSASWPTLPPGLHFPRLACRPTLPPGFRSVARPSWPAQGSGLPPRDAAPPSSASSHCRVKPPWLPTSLPTDVSSPSPGRHTATRASVSHPLGSPRSCLSVAPPPASFGAPERPEAKLR